MKSIFFDNIEYKKFVKTQIKKNIPDDIHTLNKRPTSINMELFTIYNEHFNIIQNNIQRNRYK